MYIILNLPPYLRIIEAEAMWAGDALGWQSETLPYPSTDVGSRKRKLTYGGEGNTPGFV